jgi:eukaryotic-like serine/threonine-protein kinase
MSVEDPLIGTAILDGQFKILRKIGAGGMGAVYMAEQTDMNRHVAIKVLHSRLLERKDIAARFRREARAISHLTHPNTVRVFLYGELPDGSLYIIMEYLEGMNLNQAAKRGGPMAPERAVRILAQACRSLDEAHRAGMIHRDLKPENIFLCNQGGIEDFAKVLDFGLAKVTEREMRPDSVEYTKEGMVFGTPEFMSPEQALGKPLSPASDVYALGIILYEVLTGKLPFDAKAPLEYLQAHATRSPIPINERVPGLEVPENLWFVIEKALQKPAEARQQSAALLADELEGAIGIANSTARLPSATARVSSERPVVSTLSLDMPGTIAAPAPQGDSVTAVSGGGAAASAVPAATAAAAATAEESAGTHASGAGPASAMARRGPVQDETPLPPAKYAVDDPFARRNASDGAAGPPAWIWVVVAFAFVAGVVLTALLMRSK